jgi:hypothetical protein
MPLDCLICMEMFGSGARISGTIIIRERQQTEALGVVRMIVSGSCGAALGTTVLTIVVLPFVTGVRQFIGTSLLVFELSVPRNCSSLTFLPFMAV